MRTTCKRLPVFAPSSDRLTQPGYNIPHFLQKSKNKYISIKWGDYKKRKQNKGTVFYAFIVF